MAAQAKVHNAVPYIMLTPARNDYPDVQANTTVYDATLESQARSAGYHVINLYDALDTNQYNGIYDAYNATNHIDAIHPNEHGNNILAAYISRNILATQNLYVGSNLSQTIDSTGDIINSRSIYPTDTKISFFAKPTAGTLNIDVSAWNKTGDYKKIWHESSATETSTTHIIGDFPANTPVQILRDGAKYASVTTNDTGYINWVYNGGDSTHEFDAYPTFITPESGIHPLTVSAQYPGNISWDFESDGVIDSTTSNTTHTYWVAGNYTISYIINNETFTQNITVSNPTFWSNTTAKINWITTWVKNIFVAGVMAQ
jgi:hypothetical protein